MYFVYMYCLFVCKCVFVYVCVYLYVCVLCLSVSKCYVSVCICCSQVGLYLCSRRIGKKCILTFKFAKKKLFRAKVFGQIHIFSLPAGGEGSFG